MNIKNTNIDEKSISDMLSFDGLAEAERITGQDYKTSDVTSFLGMGLARDNNQKLSAALELKDDTVFTNQLDNYVRIITDEGFESVLTVPFVGNNDSDESLNIYWHSDGILLVFDTYDTERVNGGKFLYNWIPDDRSTMYRYTSSGGLATSDGQDVWCGSHDCRQALRHNIKRLRDNGTFLSQWISTPFLWLLHHGDVKNDDYDYKEINKQRSAMLPEDVQRSILVLEASS